MNRQSGFVGIQRCRRAHPVDERLRQPMLEAFALRFMPGRIRRELAPSDSTCFAFD